MRAARRAGGRVPPADRDAPIELREALPEVLPPDPRPERLPTVLLKYRKQGAHPWLFRRMLDGPHLNLEPGRIVEVTDKAGQFLGYGFYNPNSEIACRLLSTRRDRFPGPNWFRETVFRAARLRHDVLGLPKRTDAYRVIHSEGDGLSGLVVDRLGSVLAAEIFCAGVRRQWEWIAAALDEAFPGLSLVTRADGRAEKHEGVPLQVDSADVDSVEVTEGRLRFRVDLREGHKTGFFADQRENRARFGRLCRGQSVFDGCCYSGGFTLNAWQNGARSIEAVDLDEDAVAVARENLGLNQVPPEANLSLRHANVFQALRDCQQRKQRFTRMVLDPPKWAVGKNELPKAMQSYADLNRLGMQCLAPGGVLLTCSCTGLVSEDAFIQMLRDAAVQARVDLQIFHLGGPGEDHPVSVHTPEGRYLKAVFARVFPLG